MAMLIQVLLNVNRDSEQRREPFAIEEVLGWLGYGEEGTPAPAPPQRTVEELDQAITRMHQMYTAIQSSNGEVQGA